jgi:hypothetical protein
MRAAANENYIYSRSQIWSVHNVWRIAFDGVIITVHIFNGIVTISATTYYLDRKNTAELCYDMHRSSRLQKS